MRIDPFDQLFYDLEDSEAEELCQWSEDVVLRGKIAYPSPPWVRQWMDTLGLDDRQALLIISTALPQRILISLVRFYRSRYARA